MHNLSIRSRLLFILAALMLPIGVLVYNLLVELEKNITFAEMQMKGVAYEKPLIKLLDEIADYQVTSLRKEHGDTEVEDILADGRTSIDSLFSNLDDVDQSYGTDLKLSTELNPNKALTADALKAKWEAIKAGDYNPEAYTALLQDIASTVKLLGQNSNMMLDPELDSYYLVDAAISAFPQTLA